MSKVLDFNLANNFPKGFMKVVERIAMNNFDEDDFSWKPKENVLQGVISYTRQLMRTGSAYDV